MRPYVCVVDNSIWTEMRKKKSEEESVRRIEHMKLIFSPRYEIWHWEKAFFSSFFFCSLFRYWFEDAGDERRPRSADRLTRIESVHDHQEMNQIVIRVSHCLRTRRQSGLMDLFVIWFSWWCSFVYFLPWWHDECTSRTNNERKRERERRVRANGIVVSLSSFIRYSLSSILVVIID